MIKREKEKFRYTDVSVWNKPALRVASDITITIEEMVEKYGIDKTKIFVSIDGEEESYIRVYGYSEESDEELAERIRFMDVLSKNNINTYINYLTNAGYEVKKLEVMS